MIKLSRYEKETILLTSEGEKTWDMYTYNRSLQKRLRRFSNECPEKCRLLSRNNEGAETYLIDKSCISIHLLKPESRVRKRVKSTYVKAVYGKS